MMNVTINDTLVKQKPDSSDFVPVWDTTTSQQKKVPFDSFTNPGGIANFGFRAGAWYLPHYLADTGGALSISPNILRIIPFLCPITTSFVNIGISVNSANASGSFRVGIYELLSGFSLGKVLAQNTGSLASTGFVSVSIALNAPLKGWYGLALNTSTSCSLAAHQNNMRASLFGSQSPPLSLVSYFSQSLAFGTFANNQGFSPTLEISLVPVLWLRAG